MQSILFQLLQGKWMILKVPLQFAFLLIPTWTYLLITKNNICVIDMIRMA